MAETAKVITLPVTSDKPDCRDCVKSVSSPTEGTRCLLFDEVILSEALVAPECEHFERED